MTQSSGVEEKLDAIHDWLITGEVGVLIHYVNLHPEGSGQENTVSGRGSIQT